MQPGGDGASRFYGLWPGGDEHVSRSTVRGYVPAGKPNIGATAESPTTGPLRTQLSERAWRNKHGTEGDFLRWTRNPHGIKPASNRTNTVQTGPKQFTQKTRIFFPITKELQKNCKRIAQKNSTKRCAFWGSDFGRFSRYRDRGSGDTQV